MTKYLITFIFTCLVIQVSSSCPQNSFEWQDICYQYQSQETSYANAEVACVQAGGHLASIHDGLLNNALGQQASNFIHVATQPWIWIGLSKLGSSDWTWEDKSSRNFTNWKDGYPKDDNNKKCVLLTVSDGSWFNDACAATRPYVCVLGTSSGSSTTDSSGTNCLIVSGIIFLSFLIF